jgi:predicted Zn-dependent protease with MMP-like domain
MPWTSGPIFIYAGQIYEDCRMNMEEAMKSVRQVYYHELAHAIGDLEEEEVKERGL